MNSRAVDLPRQRQLRAWMLGLAFLAAGCWSDYRLEGDGACGHPDRDGDAPVDGDAADTSPDGSDGDGDGRDDAGDGIPDGLDGDGTGDGGEDDGGDPCDGVPPIPIPVSPLSGTATGSIHAPSAFGVRRPLLRWIPGGPSCPTVVYDVQIDDSCDPLDFADCTLRSLEAFAIDIPETSWRPELDLPVSETPPVGRRYFWRVRAQRGTIWSSWSPVSYIDVARLPDDSNGDGYSELLTGSPDGRLRDDPSLPSSRTGMVALFYGGPSGFDPEDRSEHGLPGPTECMTAGIPSTCQLGGGMTWLGDREGDGFADAVLTSGPEEYVHDEFYLLAGREDRPPMRPDLFWTAPWLSPAYRRDYLLPVGDIDQDGRPDLGIIPAQTDYGVDPPPEGDFFLLFTAGDLPLRPFLRPDAVPGAPAGCGADDLDDDGQADLLLGFPGPESALVLIPGRPHGWRERDMITLAHPDPESVDSLFRWFVVADFDGDERPELATAGKHPDRVIDGDFEVRTFRVGRDGLTGLQAFPPRDAPGRAGWWLQDLAAADFDRDGFDDLAVLLVERDSRTEGGRLDLYAGGPAGLSEAPAATWALSGIAAVFPYPRVTFQRLAVVRDGNGDGYPDLAVGGNLEGERVSSVTVIQGGPDLSALELTTGLRPPANDIQALAAAPYRTGYAPR